MVLVSGAFILKCSINSRKLTANFGRKKSLGGDEGGASAGRAPGGGVPQVQSVLSRLLLLLLVPPLLHLLQPLQDLVHGLLVPRLLSQTQSLLVDPERLVEAS